MSQRPVGLLSSPIIAVLMAIGASVVAAPVAAAATSCPRVQIFGVRGSGETVDDYYGYGRTVYTVIQQTRTRLGAAAVGAARIDYPAISVGYGGIQYPSKYNASVEAGKVALTGAIEDFWTRCGAVSGIALVGYSQGAHIAGDVFQARLPSEIRDRVIALALIGDPRFNGGAAAPPNFGGFSTRLNGVYDITGSPRTFLSTQYSRVRSYCASGDPVCNFTPANAAACKLSNSCVHSRYFSQEFAGSTYTQWASYFLAVQVRRYSPTSWSRTDPGGDMVDAFNFNAGAASGESRGDITRVTVDATSARVLVVMTFRELVGPLGSGDHFQVQVGLQGSLLGKNIDVGLNDGSVYMNAGFTGTDGHPVPFVCQGQLPGFSIDAGKKQISFIVDGRWFDGERTFTVFAYSSSYTRTSGTAYQDDAL